MEFWASAEVHQPADSGLESIRVAVVPFLNSAFKQSSFSAIVGKLRYVPIVMPANMRGRYPARSKLRRQLRIYDCAPQLNYDVFVDGSFEERLREYLGGIALAARHLSGLGLTDEQIGEFSEILAKAAKLITERRN